LLLAATAAMTALSPRLTVVTDPTTRPVGLLVALAVAAGLIYLAWLWLIHRGLRSDGAMAGQARDSGRGLPVSSVRSMLILILATGVLMRLVASFGQPVLEDDFYRYLWDGGLTAAGINAYAWPPDQVVAVRDGDTAVAAPEVIVGKAGEAGPVIDRINHPHVRTIYPPVAQVAFAAAHVISPWRITGWRVVIWLSDLAALGMLAVLLRRLGLPAVWLAVYWCNPLLVKEFYLRLHMDVLLMPLLPAAALLATGRRWAGTTAAVALAMAVKVWPVLLAPIALKWATGDFRRRAIGGTVIATAGLAMLAIMVGGRGVLDAGPTVYAATWYNNDGLFRLIRWTWDAVLSPISTEAYVANTAARATVAILVLGWTLAQTLRPVADNRALVHRMLMIVAALFLLSPTQFPWYYTWLVPLLVVRPHPSLLLYTALLPLYHLHYEHPWVIWVQHVPVWLAISWEVARTRR